MVLEPKSSRALHTQSLQLAQRPALGVLKFKKNSNLALMHKASVAIKNHKNKKQPPAASFVYSDLKSRQLYSFHHPTMPSADKAHIAISTCRCQLTRWRKVVKKNTAQTIATRAAMMGNHAIKALARSAPVPPPAMVASKASGRQLVMVKVNAANAYAQPKLRPKREGDDDGWFIGGRYLL